MKSSLIARLKKIEKKIEPEPKIRIWVTKDGDKPLPPEIKNKITHHIIVRKD